MSESNLRDILCRGRSVSFNYCDRRYVVTTIPMGFRYEYAFGEDRGRKVTSVDLTDLYYRRDYGVSLCEMLQLGSNITTY